MEEGEEVVVVYEYTAALPDELSLKVGDVITRVERLEGGWWRGELNKVRGMFPDNFVKVSFIIYIRLLYLLALRVLSVWPASHFLSPYSYYNVFCNTFEKALPPII